MNYHCCSNRNSNWIRRSSRFNTQRIFVSCSSITAYTAVAGDNLLIDTQAAEVTITLPASPSMGDEVSIMDVTPTGGFATNKVTVNRNSQPIRGAASNLELVTNNQSIKLRYTNATKGWQYVYNQTT